MIDAELNTFDNDNFIVVLIAFSPMILLPISLYLMPFIIEILKYLLYL